ncbi:uncharacterized protein LOC128277081 [Anopheles cruzii]|uniref:uncharacterized protein LOC128276932 n=1 Tax=Anopheles cruzii TaxID=68878 RepID=UPI0022EC506A|nr:uncharacterized protein LOC128276932 [Anopheles cruzii]XP_052871489.1 uncharacterized protein LOC128277081 [Anopheles cruzii]
MTKMGLIRKCEGLGLSTDGDKKTLAQRIIQHMQPGVNSDVPGNDEDGEGGVVDSANEGTSRGIVGNNDDKDDDEDDEDSPAEGSTSRYYTPLKRSSSKMERRPYTFRDVEDSIESFGATDGQDVRVWLTQFESIAKAANWNEEQKLIMCRKKLIETARRFMFAETNTTSYMKLKMALIEEFAPRLRASDVHRMLVNRRKKPAESTLDYVYEMQRIAKQISLDEQSVCGYIIDGITRSEFHRATLYEAKTVSELKQKLRSYERAKEENVKVERTDKAKDEHKDQTQSGQRNKGSGVRGNSTKQCFGCGEQGHLAGECPQKQNGVKCFKCNKFGHIAKQCDKRDDTRAEQVNTVWKTPIISVEISKVKCRTLFDTGSGCNLLSKSVYHKIGSPALTTTERVFSGFGARVTKPYGRLELNITIEDEVVPQMPFYVVPTNSMSHDAILGMDSLQKVEVRFTEDGIQINKKIANPKDEEEEQITPIMMVNDESELNVPPQRESEIREIIDEFNENHKTLEECPVTLEIIPDEKMVPFRQSPSRLATCEFIMGPNEIDAFEP